MIDPVPTDPGSTLEETRAFNAQLEALLARQPPVHTVPAAVSRAARRAGRGVFPPPVFLPEARELRVAGRGGEIGLRVLDPPGPPSGVYLHVHGGGWTLGGADLQDEMLRALAEATGLLAASVEYRLAPEHPFPAAADDCEDVARWLVGDGAAQLGAPPRLTIGGESAGAHLAVLALLRLRDRHGIEGAFAAANLVFGSFDLRGTPSRWLCGDRDQILSGPTMDWFTEGFLPGVPDRERRSPEISPLFADLRALPPALFTVGTLDPLLDDTLFMEARWRAAGNRTALRVWPEAVHGFTAFPTSAGRGSLADQYAFLRETVAQMMDRQIPALPDDDPGSATENYGAGNHPRP